MEQSLPQKVKRIPVPTPLENFSFLATDDDDILTVTPEKTLSPKIRLTTESLKESSFIYDEVKVNKTKVHFNRSVSVFRISPSQTTNTEESFEDSSPDDDFKFDSSLDRKEPRRSSSNILSQYERISELAKKIDAIDIKVDKTISNSLGMAVKSCGPQGRTDEGSKSTNPLNCATSSDSAESSSEAAESDGSLIITDIYFDDEAGEWGHEDEEEEEVTMRCFSDSCDEESTTQTALSGLSDIVSGDTAGPSISSEKPSGEIFLTMPRISSLGKGTYVPAPVEKASLLKKLVSSMGQQRSLPEVKCPVEVEGGPQPMFEPVPNTTLKYSADIDRLKRQSFDEEKKKLTDPKVRSKIEAKALLKLNPKDKELFKNLVSIEVDEEELCRRARERMPKVTWRKRKKEKKVVQSEPPAEQPKIAMSTPDPMDQCREDFVVPNPPPVIPCDSLGPSSPQPEMEDLDIYDDFIRHMQSWEQPKITTTTPDPMDRYREDHVVPNPRPVVPCDPTGPPSPQSEAENLDVISDFIRHMQSWEPRDDDDYYYDVDDDDEYEVHEDTSSII